jgi:hypothetical protein
MAFLGPVAGASDDEDLRMVQQAIQARGSQELFLPAPSRLALSVPAYAQNDRPPCSRLQSLVLAAGGG